MELMMKYQYTYFIHPYVIDSNKYDKYMLSLLKNKNCKLRIFEKEKDMHLYNYFLPDIRKYMFWSMGLSKSGLKSFESLDTKLKANLLAKHNCNIFQYKLDKDLQGKIGEKEGIFFEISEMKLICFKTGICFLVFKTLLQDNKKFSDILNFNYKFREINSKTYNLKEYENIKLQLDTFKDVKDISTVIKDLTGSTNYSEKINWDDGKFITYSYVCLDQSSWNEETETEALRNEFEKYRLVLPMDKHIVDSIRADEEIEIDENRYIKYGFSNTGTVLLTSDINTSNYTTVAQKYESEYLYTYIFILYKKFLLNKIGNEFNPNEHFPEVENEFLNFTKKLWIQEITNDEFGKVLEKKWNDCLNIEETFMKLKSQYDIMYKKYNIGRFSEKNGKLVIFTVILIVIGIINMILLWK